ncbi:MAG TPA: diacylglycerol kinase family protein [Actinomycetota bacterium]|nr:diacylglycerol kinase family protein [Actinomycetota bacterium]
MRLLLIANVEAQAVTPRAAAVVLRTLAADLEVDLIHTTHPGHATDLAREARGTVEMVVAMGGDGTVNEVANGLAGSDVTLGIVPGGGANVFARSLGIPRDPVEATRLLVARRERRGRRVTLGRALGRHFLFACGIGLDGAVVRRVERRRPVRKALGQLSYVWAGLTQIARFDRRHPKLAVRWGASLEHRRSRIFVAIAQNTDPFTYLGALPMRLSPTAGLETGLDLVGLARAGIPTILGVAAGAFRGRGRHLERDAVLHVRDQARIEVRSEVPLPVQMDGEYVGDHELLELEAVPGALSLAY